MALKWIIFLRPNFIFIFQKIRQTSQVTCLFQRKKRFKSNENYAFWVASRSIHIPRSGFQTGAQNHAKWRQNASQITAKWAWKNIDSGRAMLKNARRRPTCKITWKRVRFCRTGVALRTPWMQKSFKIIEILPWNHHKKYECRCCNGQQRTLSIDLRTCIKTRWCLSLPVLLCSRHGCEIRSNNRKSSMVTFNLSTVVPAARRANSKCI